MYTDEAGGYEPPIAATHGSPASASSTKPDTQLTDNQHALLREPTREVARVQRASRRDQGGTALRNAARTLNPQTEEGVVVPNSRGGGRQATIL